MWVTKSGATLFRPGLGGNPVDDVREAVYGRDHGRCRSCNVAINADAAVYELIAPDLEPTVDHLVCACPICAAPLRLHALTLSDAFLIWYPQISQRVLAYLVMARYAAEAAPETADAAKSLDAHILAARDAAFDRIGTYDPVILADSLMTIRQAALGEIPPPPRNELPADTAARAEKIGTAAVSFACEKLAGLRVWPKRAFLARHIETFAAYQQFPPALWATR